MLRYPVLIPILGSVMVIDWVDPTLPEAGSDDPSDEAAAKFCKPLLLLRAILLGIDAPIRLDLLQ